MYNVENENPSEIANSDIDELDPITRLSTIRVKNKRGLIMAHLNINSIRNKFGDLKFLISNNVDILVISETNIDESFPTSQFQIEGLKSLFVVIEMQTEEGFLCLAETKFQQIE